MAVELAPSTEAPVEGADPEAAAPVAKPAPAKAAKAGKGKADKGKADKGKAGKGKADKGTKAGKAAAPAPAGTRGPLLFLAEHPRAVHSIARAKAWGGLAGFLLGGYLSLPSETLPAAGLRALAAGAVCYVAVWAGAVFLWRRLVVAELRGAQQAEIARRLPAAAPSKLPGPPSRIGPA
jgi:hypothetical protein